MEDINPHLMDDIKLPTAWNSDTIEAFKYELFAQTAELELLYSDAFIMQKMIKAWSARRFPIWEKLEATLHLEYRPLSNWDRHEERTINVVHDNTQHHTGDTTDTTTNSASENTSESINTTMNEDSTNTRTDNLNQATLLEATTEEVDITKVAGFNSESLVNRESLDKDIDTSSTETVTNTGTQVNNIEGSNTGTSTKTGEVTSGYTQAVNGSRNLTDTDNGTTATTELYEAYGNVGVLSNQQLLQMERDVIDFDLMQIIIDEFIRRFCLLVY